jgi:hypothetical protein
MYIYFNDILNILVSYIWISVIYIYVNIFALQTEENLQMTCTCVNILQLPLSIFKVGAIHCHTSTGR